MRAFKLLLTLLILSFAPAVLAQDDCPSIAKAALGAVDSACTNTGRNQVCYGNITLKATPRDGASLAFTKAGDIANVADVQTLQLSSMSLSDQSWGVALMQLQANLPDTLPGQNVTILLFGNVSIADAGDQVVEVPVTATSGVNVRLRPSTNGSVLQALKRGQTITAVGRLSDGSWIRVRLDDNSFGWVAASFLNGDLNSLLTTEAGAPAFGPMQAFTFTTGVGDRPCSQVPDSGILIQTPKGAGTVQLRANNVDIQLGSTVYLQAVPGDALYISVVEGHAVLTAGGTTQVVPAGTMTTVPLDSKGVASGPPKFPQPYDATALQVLPLDVLPKQVALVTPVPAAEVPQAIDIDNGQPPDGGIWQNVWTTIHIPDHVCGIGQSLRLGVETQSSPINFNSDRSTMTFTAITSEVGGVGDFQPLKLFRTGASSYAASYFSGDWAITFTSPTTYTGTRVGWRQNPPCSWNQTLAGTYNP